MRRNPQEIIDLLRAEGWEAKKTANPIGNIRYNPYKLWMPPFGNGYNFFHDFGLIFGTNHRYNAPPFRWVRVQKKIFKNDNVYKLWLQRDADKLSEINKLISVETKKLRKAYVKKHKLKGTKAKYNSLYDSSAKLQALEVQRNECMGNNPDVVLKSGKVYYACYYVEPEEVLDNGTNDALINTIIFNLEKFNAS
jgi:hypothetical protein